MQSPDCLFFWINMKRPACNTSHLVMACISTIFIYLSKIYISWKFAQSRDSEGLDNICSVFYSAHWPCKLQIAKRYNLEGGEIPYLLLEGLERLAYVNFWATLLNVWGEVYLKMASEDNWISEREDGLEPVKLVLGSQTCQCSVVATRPTGSSMKSISQHICEKLMTEAHLWRFQKVLFWISHPILVPGR